VQEHFLIQEYLLRASSSPWYKLIGMKPRIVNGEVVVELDLDEEKHLQALGTVHGGVIASVLDATIALNIIKRLVESEGGSVRVAVTSQLNVHYLRPVSKGRVVGVGRPIYIGSKIAVGYGEARVENDVVAVATATFVIRKIGGESPPLPTNLP
jgi:acyl-CoA thioesterase